MQNLDMPVCAAHPTFIIDHIFFCKLKSYDIMTPPATAVPEPEPPKIANFVSLKQNQEDSLTDEMLNLNGLISGLNHLRNVDVRYQEVVDGIVKYITVILMKMRADIATITTLRGCCEAGANHDISLTRALSRMLHDTTYRSSSDEDPLLRIQEAFDHLLEAEGRIQSLYAYDE